MTQGASCNGSKQMEHSAYSSANVIVLSCSVPLLASWKSFSRGVVVSNGCGCTTAAGGVGTNLVCSADGSSLDVWQPMLLRERRARFLLSIRHFDGTPLPKLRPIPILAMAALWRTFSALSTSTDYSMSFLTLDRTHSIVCHL